MTKKPLKPRITKGEYGCIYMGINGAKEKGRLNSKLFLLYYVSCFSSLYKLII